MTDWFIFPFVKSTQVPNMLEFRPFDEDIGILKHDAVSLERYAAMFPDLYAQFPLANEARWELITNNFPPRNLPFILCTAARLLEQLLTAKSEYRIIAMRCGYSDAIIDSKEADEVKFEVLRYIISLMPASVVFADHLDLNTNYRLIFEQIHDACKEYLSVQHLVEMPLPIVSASSDSNKIVSESISHLSEPSRRDTMITHIQELANRAFSIYFAKQEDLTIEQSKKSAEHYAANWRTMQPNADAKQNPVSGQSILGLFILSMIRSSNFKIRALGLRFNKYGVRTLSSSRSSLCTLSNYEKSSLTADNWHRAIFPVADGGIEGRVHIQVSPLSTLCTETSRYSDIPSKLTYPDSLEQEGVLTCFNIFHYHVALPFAEYGQLLKNAVPTCPIIVEEGLFGEIQLSLCDVFVSLTALASLAQSSHATLMAYCEELARKEPNLAFLKVLPEYIQSDLRVRFSSTGTASS